MFDLNLSGDFNSTTITVQAVTEKGKSFLAEIFGAGAVSIELPKSKGNDFIVFAQRKGLTVA